MAWTDEKIETLKSLWGKGLTASQIATEIGDGISRNAVIGKAHRLKLSGRPSPIQRSPTGKPKPKRTHLSRPMVRSTPAPAPVVRAVPLQLGNQSCLWPIGDPGDANFHFCGSAAVVAKPYCPEHCARAYITKTRQGSKAA